VIVTWPFLLSSCLLLYSYFLFPFLLLFFGLLATKVPAAVMEERAIHPGHTFSPNNGSHFQRFIVYMKPHSIMFYSHVLLHSFPFSHLRYLPSISNSSLQVHNPVARTFSFPFATKECVMNVRPRNTSPPHSLPPTNISTYPFSRLSAQSSQTAELRSIEQLDG
jgi:hypothetical protein